MPSGPRDTAGGAFHYYVLVEYLAKGLRLPRRRRGGNYCLLAHNREGEGAAITYIIQILLLARFSRRPSPSSFAVCQSSDRGSPRLARQHVNGIIIIPAWHIPAGSALHELTSVLNHILFVIDCKSFVIG